MEKLITMEHDGAAVHAAAYGAIRRLLRPGADPRLEGDFARRHTERSLRQIRFVMGFGMLVYAAFALVDINVLPRFAPLFLFVRFGLFLPVNILMFALWPTRFFQRHFQPLIATYAVLAGTGLVFIHAVASAQGVSGYQYGVFFTLVFIFTLCRLRFLWAAAAGALLVMGLLTVNSLVPAMPEAVKVDTLVAFLALDLFGMAAVWFMERQEWREFILQRQLADEKRNVETLNRELEGRVNERTRQLAASAEALEQSKRELFTALEENRQAQARLKQEVLEREEMQRKLAFLSYHDALTGLHNRRFFEEETERLDVPRNLPLTLLMADVNGLKLINDSLGHAQGDAMLVETARIMREACRADDLLARLGGDEFIVLLPRTDAAQAEAIAERMRQLAGASRVGPLRLSVSFGAGTKQYAGIPLQEAFNQAESAMYRGKLVESPAFRLDAVEAMLSVLWERDFREEEHARLVSGWCRDMGKALGLPDAKAEELGRLGRLHDIGKIGIMQGLGNKRGALDADEWAEIRRHPEVGYRILNTVGDLAGMAPAVLAHHERWDGHGYPKGLSGEAIPLEARIIAVADAYEAMTGDRIYRIPASIDAARGELARAAGTQFDPELVRLFLTKVLHREA